MKKIISYSLWGEDTRYTDGAIRNVELAQNLYKIGYVGFILETQHQ